ncbi:MAG: 3-oxoacyl-ACP reductase FabG [Desulfurococcales archaeon]|nr:3-oxoacyl-ACP reductase FabG [Desulfurococcales archaeon]
MKGRSALVTGASRGLGRAIAVELASQGAFVFINYRKRGEEAKETLRLVRETGGDGVIIRADVSDPSQVDEMFDTIKRHTGGVDILVNNAGWGMISPLDSMEDRLWERHIAVNLNSVFYCTRRAVPYMIEKGWGRIVNVTSIAGLKGVKWLSAYSAAKAGVIGFTRAAAQDLAHTGVTVNAVAAGFARTDMGLSFFKATGIPLEEFSRRFTLTGSILEPIEVARLVVFLASDEASNITGQVYVIDSGMSLATDYTSLIEG